MLAGALFDQAGDRCLVPQVWKAAGTWERMRGLLGRPRLGSGEGMLLEPCRMVHTFGMRYALDLAFIDWQGRVCKLVYGLAPGRLAGSARAHATLELAAGALSVTGLRLGDAVAWRGAAA